MRLHRPQAMPEPGGPHRAHLLLCIRSVTPNLLRMIQPLLPAQRIGNYVLIRPLGQGGFGQVWQAAHHERPGCDYAVKVALDPALRQQHQREGRLPDLRHPNIIEILDADTQHDPPYVVMPLAPGGDLALAIRNAGPGGLPEARVRELIVGILEGPAHAHARGMVHRDVKPGNILIEADGRPLLAAFSLSAQAAHGAPAEPLSMQRSAVISRTSDAHAATMVGTLAYMAPEVHEGCEATAASDIYSLGVMLFEMLAGRRPSGLELPSMARPGLEASALWDALYYWACNRPEERFAHAGDMLEAWRRSPKPIPFLAGSLRELPPIPAPAPLPADLNEALRAGHRDVQNLRNDLNRAHTELTRLHDIYTDIHPEVRRKHFAIQAYEQALTEAIVRFRGVGIRMLAGMREREAVLTARRQTLLLEGMKERHPDVLAIDKEVGSLRETLADAEAYFEGGQVNRFQDMFLAWIALNPDSPIDKLSIFLARCGDAPGNPWALEVESWKQAALEREAKAQQEQEAALQQIAPRKQKHEARVHRDYTRAHYLIGAMMGVATALFANILVFTDGLGMGNFFAILGTTMLYGGAGFSIGFFLIVLVNLVEKGISDQQQFVLGMCVLILGLTSALFGMRSANATIYHIQNWGGIGSEQVRTDL